ncbi:M28 family peptidase [bacterium]|nr:M28 family peptidase [bacterium]
MLYRNVQSLSYARFSIWLVLFFVYSCALPKSNLTIDPLLLDVRQDRIKSHISFLADDRLMGRFPGKPGFHEAAEYVINNYKAFGLLPAGENGTFLQTVRLRTGIIEKNESSLIIMSDTNKTVLTEGDEYVFIGDLNNSQNYVSAPVVFVGYGVEAPHMGYDDYKNKNVRNKIVVATIGVPDSFPSTEAVHFSTNATKFESAIKHGAVGMILTLPGNSLGRMMHRYRDIGNDGVVAADGKAFGKNVFGSGLKFAAIVSWDAMKKIFNSDPEQYWIRYDKSAQGDSITIQISAKTKTSYTDITSYNIIGKMTGRDDHLKNEYVIYTSHLDHLGVGHPVDGDSIYNGAHDNASGVACTLEIARLFTSLIQKPNRSVLFLTTTGEEMGLLGSEYFTRFPTVTKENIIADINIDMPTLIAPLLSIEALGAEHSNLMTYAKGAATQLGLDIMPDHMPEQARIVRSDQYNFLRQGIPAMHIKYGLKTLDSTRNLATEIKDFMNHTYHTPSDELNESFDFTAAETFVKINFMIGYSLTQTRVRPFINKGDVFENENKAK